MEVDFFFDPNRFRSSDKNASIAGDIHLSLCQTAKVRIAKSGPDQRRDANFPVAISEPATIAGRQAMPMPRAAHCLIVSTLLNSITALGLTLAVTRACSSLDR